MGKPINNVEAIFVAKDGRQIWVEGSASCHIEGGKPVATSGIFRDITERKQIEKALAAEKEHLAVTLRSNRRRTDCCRCKRQNSFNK